MSVCTADFSWWRSVDPSSTDGEVRTPSLFKAKPWERVIPAVPRAKVGQVPVSTWYRGSLSKELSHLWSISRGLKKSTATGLMTPANSWGL